MKYLLTIMLVITSLAQFANANLLVSPTRLSFDGKERVKDVVLINVSDKTRSYRIEWQENKADENGSYSIIPDEQVTFASSPFIRYSPRQVTLKAGERQVIKLMLRRKANMNLAEYRSHLKVTALPPQTSNRETNAPVTGIDFKIDVLTSYTIPIMVRTKEPRVKVSVDSFGIEVDDNQTASFRVDLRKQGESSVTGELNVYHINERGEEKRVGILRGVNIFHENSRRVAYIQWQNYAGPVDGKIRLEYVGAEEFAGQGFVQYETSIGMNDFN